MNRPRYQRPSLPIYKQINLVLPAVFVGSLVFASLIVQGFRLDPASFKGSIYWMFGVGGLLYMIFITMWGVPNMKARPNLGWLLAVTSGAGIALIELFEQYLMPGMVIPLSLTFIVILALLSGRWPSYFFTIVAISANIITFLTRFLEQSSVFVLELIMVPVMAVVVTETILGLRRSLLVEMTRLQTLNRVARSLATSLEMHQVVTLVSNAIQNAFAADTYYVGLLTNSTMHMELFYDDGEFFPPMDITLKDTLAGRVVQSRKSLLISDLINERKQKNLPYIIVGRPKASRSWMGTPLEINGSTVGIIGVASYQKNTFDIGDLELLENIAQQAALALDNAEHHAEVETRSQHDSLTSVLNHNAFLARYERQVREAIALKHSLAIIMLDIDYFKAYNTSYGHLTGDEVLTNLCQVIRRNVKKSDLIGRWGGEEFAISLPNANGPQAFRVAERIRTTLEGSTIKDRNGRLIPAPTISQGVAVLSTEVQEFMQLVDLADRRLYVAKERGRNEIEPSLQELEDARLIAENHRPAVIN